MAHAQFSTTPNPAANWSYSVVILLPDNCSKVLSGTCVLFPFHQGVYVWALVTTSMLSYLMTLYKA